MRTTDLLFSCVYLLALLIAFSQISSLSEFGGGVTSAKFYPQLVLGAGLLVGIIETIRILLAEVQKDDPSFASTWSKTFQAKRMVLLAMFVIYLMAMKPLGFLVATGLFCFVTVVLLSPTRNAKLYVAAALVTTATLVLIYLLLVVYLQAFLP